MTWSIGQVPPARSARHQRRRLHHAAEEIGFVVLVGLAAKNAILIVEFARDMELEGKPTLDAIREPCRLACGRSR